MKLGYNTGSWSFIFDVEWNYLSAAKKEFYGSFTPYERCVLSDSERRTFQNAREEAVKAIHQELTNPTHTSEEIKG